MLCQSWSLPSEARLRGCAPTEVMLYGSQLHHLVQDRVEESVPKLFASLIHAAVREAVLLGC